MSVWAISWSQNFGLVQYDPAAVDPDLIEEIDIDDSKLKEVRLLPNQRLCSFFLHNARVQSTVAYSAIHLQE